MHDDPQYLRQVLKYGVSGDVLKKAADTELLSAMDAVMRDEIYVYPSMPYETRRKPCPFHTCTCGSVQV